MSGVMMTGRRGAALLMSTALGALAWAPAVWAEVPAQVAQAQAGQRFDIPAQPLISALTAFAQRTGLRLAYGAELAEGIASPGVSGEMTAQEALKRLLSGTGLTWRFTDARTVTLEKVSAAGAMVLDPVNVEGQAAAAAPETALGPVQGYVAKKAITASKTDTPILETPQSISVVTRDQIAAQNAQSLNQVLRYTSGVTPETRGAVATRYDMMTIRGYDADTYLNGLKLPSLYYIAPQVDPFLLERVEVLKGPTSVLYGQASAGGMINQVEKRPTETAYHEVGMELGSDRHFRSTADFAGPLDSEGKFLYRFAAVGLSEDGQIDTTENQRVAVAPTFTWRPDADTSLTVLGFYQNDPKGNSYGGVPPSGTILGNPYGTLPADFYDGDVNYEKFTRRQSAVGYEFDKRLSDMWSVRSNARAMHTSMAYDSVYANELKADNRTLERGTATSREEMSSYAMDNQVEARVATGPLKHTLLGGMDYQYVSGNYKVGFGSAPDLDIFNPDNDQTIIAPTRNRTDVHAEQLGFYAQDQIRLGGFILTLGGRHDRATQDTKTASSNVHQDNDAWTGKAGLTYVFKNGVAPYVSYSESFSPQSGVDYNGKPFDPVEGTQQEVGVKYQPPGMNSLFTAALFNLVRSNVTTGDPAHAGFSIQTGESRSRGLELEAKVSLTDQIDLTSAYTYMDTNVTKDNSGLEGNQLGAVPRHQASAWAMYHMPKDTKFDGLSLGSGVRYTGPSRNPGATLEVPAFTLVDAALTYDLGAASPTLEGAEFSLNVKNLFDTKYVASCYYGNWCAYGYERTVTAGLTYRW